MADNVTTQSGTPATPPAATKFAFRDVLYSGEQALAGVVGLVEFAGADDAKTVTDVALGTLLTAIGASLTALEAVHGTSNHHKVSAGSTNATSVVGVPAKLYAVRITNTAAYMIFVKIYNKASAPTVGTDTPFAVYGVQAGLTRDVVSPSGAALTVGLGYAITKGLADNDATAVLANDVDLELEYK